MKAAVWSGLHPMVRVAANVAHTARFAHLPVALIAFPLEECEGLV